MSWFNYTIIFCSFLAFSQSPEELFEQGNAAYNGGNHNLAIEKYEEILGLKVHSAEVYFNLGNAHYRLGNVAESVYYFEQAKRLSPEDNTIQNNAAFAENMTLDAIEILPKTQLEQFQETILLSFNLTQWAYLTIVLGWITFFLFLFYRLSREMMFKRLFFVLGCILFLGVLLSARLTQQKKSLADIRKGVIFEKEIEIWGEPNKRAEVLFLLHEGTKLEVLDGLEGWSKIRIANGSEGWIENDAFKPLD